MTISPRVIVPCTVRYAIKPKDPNTARVALTLATRSARERFLVISSRVHCEACCASCIVLDFYPVLYVLRKLFWGRHFSPVLPVSRYTSSDAGCSIYRFSSDFKSALNLTLYTLRIKKWLACHLFFWIFHLYWAK